MNRTPAHRCAQKVFSLSLLFLSVCYTLSPLSAQPAQPVQSSSALFGNAVVERKIDSLLGLMTLDEKLGQLNQICGAFDFNTKLSAITEDHLAQVRAGKVGSMLMVHGAGLTRRVQKAAGESRLKIPVLFGFDVIHGFRTTFPIPLAEASSWDTAAVEAGARVAAAEASAAGIHWTFAPMVDIARDPRWGRIIEGAGEDTYLGSKMAAARVRGFQGTDLKAPNAILACAKHFAAYGAAEGGRDYNTAEVSERTLRETYLPPFKAAVDAGAETFMSGFNEIAGVPATGSKLLLTDILRKEWKFKGFVVSDWESIIEMREHGVVATNKDAAILSINAGVDMDMEGEAYLLHLAEAVKNGKVKIETINNSVRLILQAKFKLGLFDNPYRNCDSEREKKELLSAEHRAAARDMARKSIVLLKNDANLLPLAKNLKTLAVIGSLAEAKRDMLGEWEMVGKPEDVVSLLDGIKQAAPQTKVIYAEGCKPEGNDTQGFKAAVAAARKADAVVIVLGEPASMSGEAHSRSSIDLPGVQESLLKAVVATGKPVVLVLTSGRPLSTVWAAENVKGILNAWHLGVEAGHAVADVLFGDYNPAGKLPVTVPRNAGQIPIYYNHKNTGRPVNEANRKERYKSKYIDLDSSPLYVFGHGLSYAAFDYSAPTVSERRVSPKSSVTVRVTVKNTGTRSGEEVVQLYIARTATSVTRPVRELKGFRKILLAAGESKQVDFVLEPEQLSFYNLEMKWTNEPGAVKVFVGTNAATMNAADFDVTAE